MKSLSFLRSALALADSRSALILLSAAGLNRAFEKTDRMNRLILLGVKTGQRLVEQQAAALDFFKAKPAADPVDRLFQLQ